LRACVRINSFEKAQTVYLPAFGIEAPLVARMVDKQLALFPGPRGAASVDHKQALR